MICDRRRGPPSSGSSSRSNSGCWWSVCSRRRAACTSGLAALESLVERRDRIIRLWLNVVNPVVDFSMTADGVLTFSNAAVTAQAASPAASYTLEWSRFDNASGIHHSLGQPVRVTDTRATAPSLPDDADYVSVKVVAEHPEHPAWQTPVQVYLRRSAAGWTTVGLFR